MDLKNLPMEDPAESALKRARDALGDMPISKFERIRREGETPWAKLGFSEAPPPKILDHARKLREREERKLAIAQRQADALEAQLNESRARETAAQDREATAQESERVARAQARMANWFAGGSFVVAVIALLWAAL